MMSRLLFPCFTSLLFYGFQYSVALFRMLCLFGHCPSLALSRSGIVALAPWAAMAWYQSRVSNAPSPDTAQYRHRFVPARLETLQHHRPHAWRPPPQSLHDWLHPRPDEACARFSVCYSHVCVPSIRQRLSARLNQPQREGDHEMDGADVIVQCVLASARHACRWAQPDHVASIQSVSVPCQ